VVPSPLAEPFVGRGAELAALGRLAGRAADGHGQVVLVTGPAGMGKTALVRRGLAGGPLARAILASGDADERSLTGGLLDQLAQAAVTRAPGHDATADAAARLRDLLRAGGPDPLSRVRFRGRAARRPRAASGRGQPRGRPRAAGSA